jgi:hypothetical protein
MSRFLKGPCIALTIVVLLACAANDVVHGLFLIAQAVSTTSGSGSLQLYESGTLEESISDLYFSDGLNMRV